jgi:hypothetical protein
MSAVASSSSEGRSWCFTLNNYSSLALPSAVYSFDPLRRGPALFDVKLFGELMFKDGCKYLVVGEEVGESGTPHLQGFVYFKQSRSLRALKNSFWGKYAHLELKKGTFAQASDYCKKDGKFFEKGIMPADPKEKGKRSEEMYSTCIALAEAGKFDELKSYAPGFYVSHFNTWQKLAVDANQRPSDLDYCSGIWLSGCSGTGKSHLVRSLGLEIYDKLFNKWWCGFRGQPIALLDDADPDNTKYLHCHLKRWMDKYWFNGEVKCSSRNLRPKFIVVTSQYTIEECFAGADRTIEAIRRRCCSYEVTEENRSMLAFTIRGFMLSKVPNLFPECVSPPASPRLASLESPLAGDALSQIVRRIDLSRSPSPRRSYSSQLSENFGIFSSWRPGQSSVEVSSGGLIRPSVDSSFSPLSQSCGVEEASSDSDTTGPLRVASFSSEIKKTISDLLSDSD